MYKLLLVDDERHIVDTMESLFLTQTDLDFDLEVYKAYYADEAIELMNRTKIDILISDIKMPGIDGFGLADQVQKNWPDTRIIFLTAYNEFDLVYKANSYKDVRFLLKLEKEEKILDAVKNAVREIEEQFRARRVEKSLGNMQRYVLLRERNDVLLKMISEKPSREANDVFREYGIRLQQANLSSLLYIGQKLFPDGSGPDKEILFRDLAILLSSLLDSRVYNELVELSGGDYLLIMQAKDTAHPDEALLFVHQMLDTIVEKAEEQFGSILSLLLLDKLIVWEEILPALRSLQSSESGCIGSGRIYGRNSEDGARRNASMRMKYERMDTGVHVLCDKIKSGAFDEALGQLKLMNAEIESVKSRHYYPFIIAYQHIASTLLEYALKHNLIEELSFSGDLYRLFSSEFFDTWLEAFNYLEDFLQRLSMLKQEGSPADMQYFLKFIEDYVHNHLSEELSLTVLAEKMNYNASYVSRLFKQLSGRNVLEYINSVRMEYAAEQLKNSNRLVQDIARDVGITSAQYFAAAFRKTYGMSPQEYRHTHLKE